MKGTPTMTKQQAARKLAKILGRGDATEEARLYRHHMGRSAAEVRESLARWQAIDRTTDAEIRRNCNVSFIH
jgi:hypothetical protein